MSSNPQPAAKKKEHATHQLHSEKDPLRGVYRIKSLCDDGTWKYMHLNTINPADPHVELKGNDNINDKQKWTIVPLDKDVYYINNAFDNSGLIQSDGDEMHLICKPGATSRLWVISQNVDDNFSTITPNRNDAHAIGLSDSGHVTLAGINTTNKIPQWVFELVSYTSARKTYQSVFFTLTLEEAKRHEYDIIIVGSGMGGGILAGDLFDSNNMVGEKSAKHILVIEKGGLVFHSHCLNASRPAGIEDRDQLNDAFFARFRSNFTLSQDTNAEDWKGGPVYGLGGRSTVWGLFAPRIHDRNLKRYFPAKVRSELLETYYRKAETLMSVCLPTTTPVHRDFMERVNMLSSEADLEVQWQWGRIASEYSQDGNFGIPPGAYSAVDKLVEIAMSKPIDKVSEPREHELVEIVTKKPISEAREHKNFKILLETEVRAIVWDAEHPTIARGVEVRTANGCKDTIALKAGGRVVLCAGSVHTPAILLRSEVDLASKGGLHITDHDIIGYGQAFKYNNSQARSFVGSMKLQSYVRSSRDDSAELVLANMAIDASSFLPRGYVSYDNLPKWIIVFVRSAELNTANTIKLVEDEPVIRISRGKPVDKATSDMIDRSVERAKETVNRVLNVEWVGTQGSGMVPLGGVAHELGTVPMKQPCCEMCDGDPYCEAFKSRCKECKPSCEANRPYCVDEDLALHGYHGVYVCDLSVFPYSPEVNPALTLAALTLRLSREVLLKRHPNAWGLGMHTIHIVNHSGRMIKIWVGNRADVQLRDKNKEVLLEPGETHNAQRAEGIPEAVSVFRFKDNNEQGDPVFLSQPEVIVAHPGRRTAIVANSSASIANSRRPDPSTAANVAATSLD